MARIKTEHGSGHEYVIRTTDKNFLFLINILELVLDALFSKKITIFRHHYRITHTLRIFPDRVEICKFSGFEIGFPYYETAPRKDLKFKTYFMADIRDIKKSVKFYLIPCVIIVAICIFAAITKAWSFALFSVFFIPFSFSTCIKIKRKKAMSINLGYSIFREHELVDTIVNKYQFEYKDKVEKTCP